MAVTMGVYAIRNARTGQVYVGSSRRIEPRWVEHQRLLARKKHTNRLLQEDWDHFGGESFSLIILEQVDRERCLTPAEQRWVDHYRATGDGGVYNGHARIWAPIEGGRYYNDLPA